MSSLKAVFALSLAMMLGYIKDWANITVKGLEELKAHSPVPLDLKLKQKL